MSKNASVVHETCPEWCRHRPEHRIPPGDVAVHQSTPVVVPAEIDDLIVDVLISAEKWNDIDGPRRGVVIQLPHALPLDLSIEQAKRLCAVIEPWPRCRRGLAAGNFPEAWSSAGLDLVSALGAHRQRHGGHDLSGNQSGTKKGRSMPPAARVSATSSPGTWTCPPA